METAVVSLQTSSCKYDAKQRSLSKWFSKCDLWAARIRITWSFLEIQILLSHPSSTKLKTLSFNKPPSDSDACLNVRTTGLKQTRLIICNVLSYERQQCLCGSKMDFKHSPKRKIFKNDMSNVQIEGHWVWSTNVKERSSKEKWKREIRRQWGPLKTIEKKRKPKEIR